MADIKDYQMQIHSLVMQLEDLYAERETYGDPASQNQMLRNLEAQLVDLYQEKQSLGMSIDEVRHALKSMEEQIIAYVDEKQEFEAKFDALRKQVDQMKQKSKALGAAVFEAALFGDEEVETERVRVAS